MQSGSSVSSSGMNTPTRWQDMEVEVHITQAMTLKIPIHFTTKCRLVEGIY